MQESLFYVFAALTLASALGVVACRNPVNSTFAMILALAGVAANFFLLEAPFLGTLLLFVYAGTVLVLFLFVIMLLDTERERRRAVTWHKLAAGTVLLAAIGGAGLWLVFGTGHLPAGATATTAATTAAKKSGAEKTFAAEGSPPLAAPTGATGTYATGAKAYGKLLFTKYMLPVQMTGFLLLAAMVGVVVVSKRKRAAVDTGATAEDAATPTAAPTPPPNSEHPSPSTSATTSASTSATTPAAPPAAS
jgi:NADH-quinone oxidoreductase subunit J